MRARRNFENQKLPRAPPKTFLNLFVDKCRRRPPPGEGAVRARARARAKYPEFFLSDIMICNHNKMKQRASIKNETLCEHFQKYQFCLKQSGVFNSKLHFR